MYIILTQNYFLYALQDNDLYLWSGNPLFSELKDFQVETLYSDNTSQIIQVQPLLVFRQIYFKVNIQYSNKIIQQVHIISKDLVFLAFQVQTLVANIKISISGIQNTVEIKFDKNLYLQQFQMVILTKFFKKQSQKFIAYKIAEEDSKLVYNLQSDLESRIKSGLKQIWIEYTIKLSDEIQFQFSLRVHDIQFKNYENFIGKSQIMLFPNAIQITSFQSTNFLKYMKQFQAQGVKNILIYLVLNVLDNKQQASNTSRKFFINVAFKRFFDAELNIYCNEMETPADCYLYIYQCQFIEEHTIVGFVDFQFISSQVYQQIFSFNEFVHNYCAKSMKLQLYGKYLTVMIQSSTNSLLCPRFYDQQVMFYIDQVNQMHYPSIAAKDDHIVTLTYFIKSNNFSTILKLNNAQIDGIIQIMNTKQFQRVATIQLLNNQTIMDSTFPYISEIEYIQKDNILQLILGSVCLATTILIIISIVLLRRRSKKIGIQ